MSSDGERKLLVVHSSDAVIGAWRAGPLKDQKEMRVAGIIIESADGKRRAIVKPVLSKDRKVHLQVGSVLISNVPAVDVEMDLYDITASRHGRLIQVHRVETLGFPEIRLMMKAIEPDLGEPTEDDMLLFAQRFLGAFQ